MKLKCIFCSKGERCPIHSVSAGFKVKEIDNINSASPPSIFIGSKLKYPTVNVGVLSPLDDIKENWIYDAPTYWSEHNYNVKQIVKLRAALINSRVRSDVYSKEKLISSFQEIGMAVKPVDVNIDLSKKVKFKVNTDDITLPVGPGARLKKLKVVSNPKIPQKVDKVVSDVDLKAVEGLKYLYKSGFGEQELTQLLSIGVLGLKKNRKLVPTRFSITATDDSLGKMIIKEIKDYRMVEDYMMFFGGYLGNYYLVLLFPEVYSYELFESYLPGGVWGSKMRWVTDYEPYSGRKGYAFRTAGGYYAARLPVLEYLKKIKKQASILVLRFISSEYEVPLGVFVCRSAARKSVNSESFKFLTKEELVKEAKNLIFNRFKVDISCILKESLLLKSIKEQSKLKEFI